MSQLKLKPLRTQTEARLQVFRSVATQLFESTSSSCNCRRYGKAGRSAGEVRRIVDQAMGTKLLTEVLDETRKANP